MAEFEKMPDHRELTDFEHELYQLRPAEWPGRSEEVFYRAGWAAGRSSWNVSTNAARGNSSRSKTFTLGLVCGLLLSVAVALFHQDSPTIIDTVSVPMPSNLVSGDSDSAGNISISMNRTDEARAENRTAVRNLAGSLLPWNWRRHNLPELQVPLAEEPLSPVARQYWSSLVGPEIHVRSVGGDATSELESGENDDRLRLHPFGLDAEFVDDLL